MCCGSFSFVALFRSGLLCCGFFHWLQWHILEYMFIINSTFSVITTLIDML